MNLSHVFEIVRRQWVAFLVVLAIGTFAIVSYSFKTKESYVGASHVLLVSQPGAHDSTVSIADLPTLATSTNVLERVQKSLSSPVSLPSLKSHISAKVVNRSSIMEISYRDPDKSLAIGVPNAVADNLAAYYGEISADSYTRNVKNLTDALGLQGKKVGELNRRLGAAIANDPFVVSDRATDDVTERLDTLETDRALAAADAAGTSAVAAATAPNAGLSKIARHEILVGDPRYKQLTESSARDFATLASDKAGYTDRFPGLAGEVAKVQGESKAIAAEAKTALSDPNRFSPSEAASQATHARDSALIVGSKERVAKLDALIAEEKSRLTDLPTSGLSYSTLRAQRDAAQLDYNALSARRASALANRAEAFSLGSLQVLDRAVSADTQIGSQRPMIAFVVSLVLIALAFGAAFLVDALDPRLRRASQVEALYGRPVVADLGSR